MFLTDRSKDGPTGQYELVLELHSSFTNRCTFIRTLIKIYIKLDGSYMFRSTTIIVELAIEPG